VIARLAALILALTIAPAVAQSMLDSPLPLKPDDAFGQEVVLPERTILYFRGHGTWDAAFEALIDAFASLREYAEQKGIKAQGNPLTVYTDTSDLGFEFLAAWPIAETPADPPKGDIAIGKTPSGRAFKFTHRGSYEAMNTTYEAITNYLDDKQLDAKDMFVEEYVTGPLKAGDNEMIVEVYVPVK
jgi:effector-binding domain-containing protein